jgi:trimethylamine:corrinoid methyltransferase-like protein
MTSDHTLQHFRQELWIPGGLWNRADWDTCLAEGGKSMADRAAERAEDILASHHAEPIAEELEKEIDAIVESARKHLLK